MSANLMGDSLIFWLENLYVHYLSYFLLKTPPSFAVVFCVTDVSTVSTLYGFSVRSSPYIKKFSVVHLPVGSKLPCRLQLRFLAFSHFHLKAIFSGIIIGLESILNST